MGDLDIRDGGVVAIDTDSLRGAAARYATLAAELSDAALTLDRGAGWLAASPAAACVRVGVQAGACLMRTHADDARAMAGSLTRIAVYYELVELTVQEQLAAASGDGIQAAWLESRRARLAAANPDLSASARHAIGARRAAVGVGVGGPANAGLLPPLLQPIVLLTAVAAQAAIRLFAHGVVRPGAVTAGPRQAVTLRRVRDTAHVSPPPNLAAALSRVPGDDARVRVETYAMPDRTRRYAVYIAGTRDFSHWFGDHDDPADMQSNLQLYAGKEGAAYQLVRDALDDAGVPAGSDVYVFGHSQGGMIANLLAVQGGYRARLLVTAGSPTAAVVGGDTVSVQLRHTDDLVQSLAGAGPARRTGAPGSMVVQRTADPKPTPDDLKLAPHHLFRYVATARLVDASADPRTAATRQRLSELRGATTVTAVEYDGTRVRPVRPDPHPDPRPAPTPPGSVVPAR